MSTVTMVNLASNGATDYSMAHVYKAWICTAPRWSIDEGVYSGETRGEATYNCFVHGREVFGRDFTFADIRARRAPEFDGPTFWRGIMPKYARMEIEAEAGRGPYNAILNQ